jgi:predicted GH43/DUF377 family glycosyl hydrolase/nucleotide-binding universal stress UspA family protein/CBS domain-containing protein
MTESEYRAPDSSGSVETLLELRRTGIVMTPDPQRPEEALGILNPASARSRNGDLFLFPRVVAKGNHSRIAIAAVTFDASGHPAAVERRGFVLEPQESYELGRDGLGGVEDPRITFIPLLDTYVMAYVALGPDFPHIALAVSKDLLAWDRLGLLNFEPIDGMDFNACDNKDCVLFPVPVQDPDGRPAFAILHRPTYRTYSVEGSTRWVLPPGIRDRRQSIWISYAPLERVTANIQELTHLFNHQLLAQPLGNWENHHIGAGGPPLLTEEGWILYYHGVYGSSPPGVRLPDDVMVYQCGVMLLDTRDPRRVYYRSARPVLGPRLESELQGTVPNVVFPTAVDLRGKSIDIYYGAADLCIASATTEFAGPVLLAPSAPALPEARHRYVIHPKSSIERPDSDSNVSGVPDINRAGLAGGHAPMQVSDVMTRTVEVINPSAVLEAAGGLMRALDIGVLPVLEADELVGIITDRDMAVRAISQGLDPRTATVGDVMTSGVVTCFDDDSLEDAASRMAEYRVRRLVVVDRAMRLAGIVSLDNVALADDSSSLAGSTLAQTSSRQDRPHGYQRILVALDGSKFAERVLPSIEPLAQKFGSIVTLLQVVAPIQGPAGAETSGGILPENWMASGTVPVTDEMRAQAETYLSSVGKALEARGLAVEIDFLEGNASEVILRRARQIRADLIAITTHSHTGIDRVMFGSVAEEVLRRASCPVLLVRVRGGR